MAWLARRDGSVLVGHGPFRKASAPPPDGVAFFVQDFTPGQNQAWQIPESFERLKLADFAARFARGPSLVCDWRPLEAAQFSQVFQ